MRARSLHPFLVIAAGCVLANTGCKNSGQEPGNAAELSTAPIPRFPAQGLPQSTASGGLGTSTAPQASDSSASLPGEQTTQDPGNHGSSSTPQDQSSSDSTTTQKEPTTNSTATNSGENSPDTNTPEQVPGQAPYVDAAYIKIARDSSGEIGQSIKWQSPRGESEYLRLGYRRAMLLGEQISLERRSYLIFDVSQVKTAKNARIEIFVFASSAATNFYGGYSSPDPFEMVEIRAVDRHSPQAIIDAPFNQKTNHSFDVDLFKDLGDGTLYAEKKITPDLLDVEHLRPTPTAAPKHQDCADLDLRACGRWIRFELNQDAVSAINASPGLWASGWNLSSVNHNQADPSDQDIDVQEWLFVGGFIDLSPDNSFYPSYLGPKPRLVIDASSQ